MIDDFLAIKAKGNVYPPSIYFLGSLHNSPNSVSGFQKKYGVVLNSFFTVYFSMRLGYSYLRLT